MSDTWQSFYEENAVNAEIAAGGTASAILLATNASKQSISKYNQSFNTLEINNNSSNCDVTIQLDGLTTRARKIAARGNWVIEPENGIFFNVIKVINLSAANALTAGDLVANAAIKKPIGR